MKRSAKFIAVVLATALALSCFCIPGLAVSGRYSDGGTFSIERISNPGQSAGQPDGLTAGTDRQNSYAWSMNKLEDDNGCWVYIGTNRNILYAALSGMAYQLPGGRDQKYVASIIDLVTNGEISTKISKESQNAVIVRYNTKTKEMQTYLDCAEYTNPGDDFNGISGFRASVAFDGAIYFNATGRTADGKSKSLILRINDNNQTVPEVVMNREGGNIRAMCVSSDGSTMYIGGTDKLPGAVGQDIVYKVTVEKTTSGNEDSFVKINNETDFERYEKPGYFTTGGDVWDMVEYGGELYMTLMTSHGAICFKAHPDDNTENNRWVWTEFAGETHGKEGGAPYGAGFGNPLNYAASPYIFKDDLYFITFSDAMDAEIYGAIGLFAALYIKPDMNTFFSQLSLMEKVMDNETYIFRYTKDKEMQMVVGDKDKCPKNIKYVAVKKAGFNTDDYSTTQYNWRAAVYNDRLYVGTFDAYPMYKYLTRLTNGDLLGMTVEETSTQLQYVINFLKLLSGNKPDEVKTARYRTTLASRLISRLDMTAYYSKIVDGLSGTELGTLIDGLIDLKSSLSSQATAASAGALLLVIDATILPLTIMRDTMGNMLRFMPKKIKEVLKPNYDSLDYICKLFENVNRVGIKRYIRVSNTIAANINPGCELYCTADGINYDTITLNGFGDEYNYGVRTLLVCGNDLYVGTANPFFGAQLWKVTDSTAK